MKTLIGLCLLAFVAAAAAQCNPCKTLKWATCDGTPCTCTVQVNKGEKQTVDCNKLIPKCFLMKAQMYRARNNLTTRSIGGKPVETALVDNDGIYDPECDNEGRFKAKQCNGTTTCWCVNSAGVRRSDKGDENIKCEAAETYWVRLELKHKPASTKVDPNQLKAGISSALNSRYNLNQDLVKDFKYDPEARLIIVDVKKPETDRTVDLAHMAYYMEKDIKALPLYKDQTPFVAKAGPTDVEMEGILVYYVDDKAPTITMQSLTGGVIAVIVVVILAVVIGLLVLFFLRKREKAQYSRAQPREMENMS